MALNMAALLRNVRMVGSVFTAVRNTLPRLSTVAYVRHNGRSKHLRSQRQMPQPSVLKVKVQGNACWVTVGV